MSEDRRTEQATGKIKLPDVTLVTVDAAYHELTVKAIEDSMRHVEFGDCLVLSDHDRYSLVSSPYAKVLPQRLRHVVFHGKSARDAEKAIWHEVPGHVHTSHFLWIQWDSWVINPSAWDDEFLKYDYVGAPWWYRDGLNVGNGGFSLRSTELMKKAAFSFPFDQPEDDVLCRRYRPELERAGYKWAPEDVAARFSFERVRWLTTRAPGAPIDWVSTFGFHGLFNWGKVLERNELDERLAMLPPRLRESPDAQLARTSGCEEHALLLRERVRAAGILTESVN